MFKPEQELIINELIHLFGSFSEGILNTSLIHTSNMIHLVIEMFGGIGRNVFDYGLFSFLPIALCICTAAG